MIFKHVYLYITEMSPWKMILLSPWKMILLGAIVVAVIAVFLCKLIHVVL